MTFYRPFFLEGGELQLLFESTAKKPQSDLTAPGYVLKMQNNLSSKVWEEKNLEFSRQYYKCCMLQQVDCF